MSILRTTTLQTLSGIEVQTVKAWLVYNHTGASITNSFGITSVTDSAAAIFIPNMTNPMTTAFYPWSGSTNDVSFCSNNDIVTPPTTTAFVVKTPDRVTGQADTLAARITVVGNLA